MIRVSCIIMGIEFAYAAETAFVSPILLEIGIEHKVSVFIFHFVSFRCDTIKSAYVNKK